MIDFIHKLKNTIPALTVLSSQLFYVYTKIPFAVCPVYIRALHPIAKSVIQCYLPAFPPRHDEFRGSDRRR